MRNRIVNQYIRVDCYIDICEGVSLTDMFTKVSKAVSDNKYFTEWLDVDIADEAIHLSGETEEETELIPGCSGSYWEPPEPSYFEGMVYQEELENDIKSVLSKAGLMQDISDIDFNDMHVDTEEELMDKIYSGVEEY